MDRSQEAIRQRSHDKLERTKIRLGGKNDQSAARIWTDFAVQTHSNFAGSSRRVVTPSLGPRFRALVTRAVARCGPETKRNRVKK
jgi:hypothetical protein